MLPKFKISFIPDLRQAWAYASNLLSATIIGFSMLPDEKQLAILGAAGLSPTQALGVAGALFLIARNLQVQRK